MNNVNNPQNNPSKKIDIFNIGPYEFSQFFHNEFVPFINALHLKKIEEHKITNRIFLIIFLCPGGILFIVSVLTRDFGAALFTFIWFVTVYIFFEKQKNMSLPDIKKNFFDFFGIKYRRYNRQNNSYSDNDVLAEEGSETIRNFSRIMGRMLVSGSISQFDDSLTFDYQGVPVDIIELNHLTNYKNFLLVSYRINKKFKGETIVKTISNLPIVELRNKEQVLLEDPVFNNNFKVLADNQIEARYLLTPSFMTRILNFQKKYNCTIDVLFNKDIFPEKSNIFLRITSDKNFFEIPGGKYWYLDVNSFYNLLQDIKEITKIFDALKLDQDIGL